MMTGLPPIEEDLTQSSNERRADAKPPEVEAERRVSDANRGKSMVTHEGQLTQNTQSAEACR